MTSLHIKNMVCDRCKKVVKEELEQLGAEVTSIELGMVTLRSPCPNMRAVEEALSSQGFELLSDPDLMMVERIKLFLISLISDLPVKLQSKLSVSISKELGKDYSALSRMFSRMEHITIEKYFVRLKLEKVKELIQESSHSFSEIANLLDYSSVNHLSSQFKATTGMSMSEYKATVQSKRIALDKIV